MRSSKLSLRQKVMQKNSRLVRRREVYGKHVPVTGMYNMSCCLCPSLMLEVVIIKAVMRFRELFVQN